MELSVERRAKGCLASVSSGRSWARWLSQATERRRCWYDVSVSDGRNLNDVRCVAPEGTFESLSRLSLTVAGDSGRRAPGGACAKCVPGLKGSCRCLVDPSRERLHGSSFAGRPV